MQAAVTFELGKKGDAMLELQELQQEKQDKKEELTEVLIEELEVESK